MADSPIDPAVWTVPGIREALARRDITTVYRVLAKAGVSQREIGGLTGQSQSDVSEIVKGRQVLFYDLLVRICDGLGVPRGWMGLAYSAGPTYRHQGWSRPGSDEDEALKRRQALLASAAAIMFDRPVLGEALGLGAAGQAWAEYPTPLPQWLGKSDVAALRNLTEAYRAAGREHGGLGEVVSPLATRADQLLSVPGTEVTVKAMHSAVADLHTLAGWCAYDGLLQADLARWHFTRAVKVATDGKDPWAQVSALQYAAFMLREQGVAEDALKLYQMAQARLLNVPGRPARLAVEQGALAVWSAAAFARLGLGDQADRELARAGEYAESNDQHDVADLLHAKAGIALALGRLDEAELCAKAAADTFSSQARRAMAGLTTTRAIIYTRAGESGAHQLAEDAIIAVDGLASVWRRAKLAPLENVLTRAGSPTGIELARAARAVRLGTVTT